MNTKTNSRKRLTRSLLSVVAAAAALATTLGAAPANASIGDSTPVLLVHGFDGGNFFDEDATADSAVPCRGTAITAWKRGLRERGFNSIKTVGYYKGDSRCDLNVPGRRDNTVNTSIDQLAREFAMMVSNEFGSQKVAVSAHSMGGLIVRRAIWGVQNHHQGFPTDINISDVVTSGSPHDGANPGNACRSVAGIFGNAPLPLQCLQLAESSSFLDALGDNPQTPQGTDWTLIGSKCDDVVTAASATTMSRVSTSLPRIHTMVFRAPSIFTGGCGLNPLGIDHTELITDPNALDEIESGLRTHN